MFAQRKEVHPFSQRPPLRLPAGQKHAGKAEKNLWKKMPAPSILERPRKQLTDPDSQFSFVTAPIKDILWVLLILHRRRMCLPSTADLLTNEALTRDRLCGWNLGKNGRTNVEESQPTRARVSELNSKRGRPPSQYYMESETQLKKINSNKTKTEPALR